MSVQQRPPLWRQVSTEELPTTGQQLPPPAQTALLPYWRPPRPVPRLLLNETPQRLAAVGTLVPRLAKVRSLPTAMPLAAGLLVLTPFLYRQRKLQALPVLPLVTAELLALQLAEQRSLPEQQAPAVKQPMPAQQRSKLWRQVSSEELPTTGRQLPPPVQMALLPFWLSPRPVPAGLLTNETPQRLAAVGTPAPRLAKVRSQPAAMPLAAGPLALAPFLYRR